MKTIETVGDLITLLKDHADLVEELRSDERALSFGGGTDTMKWKQECVDNTQRMLDNFLAEPLTIKVPE